MLRSADKRLFLGLPIATAFGAGELTRTPPPMVPPVAGHAAWYDLSRTDLLTFAGSEVSVITDRSGNGLTASRETTGTGGQACIAQNPDSNDRAVIVSGSAGTGPISFTITGLSASSRTQTLFWAGMVNSLSSIRTLWGATGNGGRLFRVSTAGKLQCTKRNVTDLATTTTLTVSVDAPFVAAMILSGTSIELRLNNGTPESFSESTTFTGGLNTHLCGGDTTASQRVPGWVAEGIVYNSTLSSGNVDLTMQYLMTKWGIS